MCSDDDIHEFTQITIVRYLLCSDRDASIDDFNPFRDVLPRSHSFFHDRDGFCARVFPNRNHGTIRSLGVEQYPIVTSDCGR